MTDQGKEWGWTSSQPGPGKERKEGGIQPRGRRCRRHQKTTAGTTEKGIKFEYLGDFGWEVAKLLYKVKID